MTSIPLRHALLGITIWGTCYWALPFEARAAGYYPLRQYCYWKS